ncbi:MAG: hypothetical protein LBU34_00410 [Planctomycetaceae bacterium]|nr:hypothetical protein [Planctomycetaceae bacterium]
MSEISFEDIKNALQRLLVGDLFGNIEHQTVILQENDVSAKLKEVKIIDVPDDSILIKIDYGEAYNNIFRSENGHLKRCDYLLIVNDIYKRNKILLFIEMKSKKVDKDEIIQKFHASECLLDYIVSILRHFHKIGFNLDKCTKRFVLFHQISIDKKRVRPVKEGSKPEDYFSIKFNPQKPPTLKLLSK